MDSKKKRNRKKKGNQGKNTGDAVTNADEAVPHSHNDDLAPKENYSGADADDAVSSVGDAVSSVGEGTQYQNHEQTPHAKQNVANADETISSSVGEVIPCDENHEPTMTQENHKASNTVYADQMSIGISDSTMELGKDRLFESKLDKLHDTIKQLEDEKGLWLQKVNEMESELEKLHNKVGYHAQNEVILEEKLNNLQNGYDMLVKKEEVLDNKVKCVEDVNGVLTHQETSLKERLSLLEETNKALQEQVKVLDETSKSTVEENQRLVVSVDELESRLQTLEAKIALTEASITKEVPENEVMNQTDLSGSFLHKQTTDFTTVISKGNELAADRGLNSSLAVTSDNIYSHVSNIPVGAYSSDHADETSVYVAEATSSNGAGQSLMNANACQGFDEPRTSGEIVPVPLDDILIHEDDPQTAEEVPFTDAPIVGAPFRLISFVARYVSGADLVNQK
ncbi:hypothetical protein CFC21_052130 [Triticum aestivum]|uniref:Uncharacterized protein n=3 Tax=Triticum TaxID=4564 RepID=A0A9R0VYI4_TRITD|nr:meiotic coiled-coil protein 3-like [Triticum dicoccoides]XP_037420849.1 meiotic coiled-coil protein 3-like [Triticum dicoccoides]XP_044363419.1 meiotic coiled-coil protein 3-like [Triticum aestivum]XP_044363420.1 meiotic coiled-coil protein 3-like [Triticum aestivum]VAH90651.1 unnamed protein product [Triticum turgidum subsp. durum]KAF7042564.1 hypothetical protein CFC21_052130 [Triticum aestivum]